MWNQKIVVPPIVCNMKTNIIANNKGHFKNMKITMANLTHLLSDISVWKSELHILSKMIYKKHHQRRREKTLQGLKRIQSCVERFCAFEDKKYLEDITSSLDSGDLDDDSTYLPSRQMLEFVLVRLMGVTALLTQTTAYCVHTFLAVQQDLEIGLFIPQSMLFLSVISRLWALSKSTCIYMVTGYNSLQKCLSHLEPTEVVWLEDPGTLPVSLRKWLEKFDRKSLTTERATVVMAELGKPCADQKLDTGSLTQQAKPPGFVEFDEETEPIVRTGQEFDDIEEEMDEDLGRSISRKKFSLKNMNKTKNTCDVPCADQTLDPGSLTRQAKPPGFVEFDEETEPIVTTGQEFDDIEEVMDEDSDRSISRKKFSSQNITKNKTKKTCVVQDYVLNSLLQKFELTNSLEDLLELIRTDCKNIDDEHCRDKCATRLQDLIVISSKMKKQQSHAKLVIKGKEIVRELLVLIINGELSMIQEDYVPRKQCKVVNLEELHTQQDVRKLLLHFKRNNSFSLEGKCVQIDNQQCAESILDALKKCMIQIKNNPNTAEQSVNKAVQAISLVVEQIQGDTPDISEDQANKSNLVPHRIQDTACKMKSRKKGKKRKFKGTPIVAKEKLEKKKRKTIVSDAQTVGIVAKGKVEKKKRKAKMCDAERVGVVEKGKIEKTKISDAERVEIVTEGKLEKMKVSDAVRVEIVAKGKIEKKKRKAKMRDAERVGVVAKGEIEKTKISDAVRVEIVAKGEIEKKKRKAKMSDAERVGIVAKGEIEKTKVSGAERVEIVAKGEIEKKKRKTKMSDAERVGIVAKGEIEKTKVSGAERVEIVAIGKIEKKKRKAKMSDAERVGIVAKGKIGKTKVSDAERVEIVAKGKIEQKKRKTKMSDAEIVEIVAKGKIEKKKRKTKISDAERVEIVAKEKIEKTKVSDAERVEIVAKGKIKNKRKTEMSDADRVEIVAKGEIEKNKRKTEMSDTKTMSSTNTAQPKRKAPSIECVNINPKKKKKTNSSANERQKLKPLTSVEKSQRKKRKARNREAKTK